MVETWSWFLGDGGARVPGYWALLAVVMTSGGFSLWAVATSTGWSTMWKRAGMISCALGFVIAFVLGLINAGVIG